jgi:hypothetical protein
MGFVATALLIISMAYNCKDKKHTVIMRALNALAALLFVIYSVFLSAYSTIFSNLIILVIDIIYIIKLLINKK